LKFKHKIMYKQTIKIIKIEINKYINAYLNNLKQKLFNHYFFFSILILKRPFEVYYNMISNIFILYFRYKLKRKNI
jgi:hypothetical protein